MKRVVVCGGGVTGLTAAYFLRQTLPAASISLVDSASRPGGWISSYKSPSNSIHEIGARSLRMNYNCRLILNMLDDLGLTGKLISPTSAAGKRCLYVNNELQLIPSNPFRRGPFSMPLILYVIRDLLRSIISKQPPDDETLYQMAKRQFGKELADVAFSAVIRGIFAGDVKELSFKSCFPDLSHHLRNKKSVTLAVLAMMRAPKEFTAKDSRLVKRAVKEKFRLFSLQGGIQTFTDELASSMREKDIDFSLSTSCDAIHYADGKMVVETSGGTIFADELVLALPSMDLARVLPAENDAQRYIKQDIMNIEYGDVAVINLEYRKEALKNLPPSFGYLVPAVQKANIIGTVFDSYCFPELDGSPDINRLTVMINKCPASVSSEYYMNLALGDLKKHLGIEADPLFARVTVNRQCIPQYKVGHSKLTESIRNAYPRIQFLGPIFHPPGVVDCVLNAYRTARKFSKSAVL